MAAFAFSYVIASLCIISTQSTLDGKTSVAWEAYFDHHTFLRPAHDYRLYWKLLEDDMIEIGLEAETNGWVAFGISNDRTMAEADIIMGWVDGDQSYLQRRHSVSLTQRFPVFDEDLSHDLVHSEEVDGVTRIQFIREMYPCPDDEVYPFAQKIVTGTTFALFAYHMDDPVCSDPEDGETCIPLMHDKLSMGSESINFLSGESTVVELPQNYESFEFTMSNYSLSYDHHTTYHCKFINLPEAVSGPHHLIRVDPIIQAGNEAAVHHIILYWCTDVHPSYTEFEDDCDSFANMPDFAGRTCKSTGINIGGWAVGAGNFYYPEHVGVPIEGFQYALLEIHYDNPDYKQDIVDNSGLKIYWTPEVRPYVMGGLAIVAPYVEIAGVNSQFIPGNLPQRVQNSFYMPPECSENIGIPEDGIKVMFGTLHAHTIGVQMKIRHIRNNVELAPIVQNDNYDFNYQEGVLLPQEVTVLPGDEFVCECVYDTTETRQYPTYGGESTRDEMCVCGMGYYPAVEGFGFSFSAHSDDQFNAFFQTAIDNDWFNGTTNMTENLLNKDTFYYDSLAEGALEHYLAFQNESSRLVACSGLFLEDYIIPESRDGFVPYQAEDDCSLIDTDTDTDTDTDVSGSSDDGSGDLSRNIIIVCVALVVFSMILVTALCVYYKRKAYKKVETENNDALPVV